MKHRPEELLRPGRPTEFGRYRVLRMLGRGAMGTVYLAEDTHLRRQVALKLPHLDGIPTDEALERFFREARAAASLRNAHICPVYDLGHVGGQYYISMAYISGSPLSVLLQSDEPQPQRKCVEMIRKLALALQEAHDHGIVHRDLKPANIMIDEKGEPIIMDFGLARHLQRDDTSLLTQSGVVVGTPAFMSPEQVSEDFGAVGPATDQYSLGVIFYELLTGQLPFRGSLISVMAQLLSKEATSPKHLRPDLDTRIDAVCLKMLSKRPGDRFGTLSAVAAELETILNQPAPIPVTAREPSIHAARKNAPPAPPETASPKPTRTRRDAAPAAKRRTAPAPSRPGNRSRSIWWVGLACGLLAFGWVAAVVIIHLGSSAVRIEIADAAVDVTLSVKGKTITISGPDERTIAVEPDPDQNVLNITYGGVTFASDRFSVKKGQTRTVTISLEGQTVKAQLDRAPLELKPGNKTRIAANPGGPDVAANVPQKSPQTAGERPEHARADEIPGPFVPLFNGKDLTGWTPDPNQPGNWRVEDGVLKGSGGAASYLFTQRSDFKDFRLRVEARINDRGNSGVFFRASSDVAKMLPLGYEAQINSTHRDRNKTGSLYVIPGGAVVSVLQTAVRPNEWFEMEIRARENEIAIAVNGKTTTTYRDEQLRYRTGRLALQQHDPGSVVEFRKIEIKEIP